MSIVSKIKISLRIQSFVRRIKAYSLKTVLDAIIIEMQKSKEKEDGFHLFSLFISILDSDMFSITTNGIKNRWNYKIHLH